MKVYREVQGDQYLCYLYYIECEGETVLWYSERTWRSRVVPQPAGELLVGGIDLLPADLVMAIQQYRNR